MDPHVEGATHIVTPQEITNLGIHRNLEEVLLAVDQSRTNNLGETQTRVENLTPRTGIPRNKGELSPVIRTEGKSQRLNQRVITIKRYIHEK